jgi:hypothetical protein
MALFTIYLIYIYIVKLTFTVNYQHLDTFQNLTKTWPNSACSVKITHWRVQNYMLGEQFNVLSKCQILHMLKLVTAKGCKRHSRVTTISSGWHDRPYLWKLECNIWYILRTLNCSPWNIILNSSMNSTIYSSIKFMES